MKAIILILLTIFVMSLSACKSLQTHAHVKEGHFRLTGFREYRGPYFETVYLSCLRQKPTDWHASKQYPAGKHRLWVVANISDTYLIDNQRRAYAKFDVTLNADINYQFNRKIHGNQIDLWIEETETKKKVSEIVTAKLSLPDFFTESQIRKQCHSSSI